MSKIKVLDDMIANQIAAGEVVERPASVVKELVENAIDAGSSIIEIEIEEGGLQLIRVRDNGHGIVQDDCELAFHRHATSKIASTRDLFRIYTLGFRGEALPSIAAVSKLELVTAASESGVASLVEIHGGELIRVEQTASKQGTQVTIKELFYNTPARLKYMKTIQTELGHISDYIYRLGFAYPEISFELNHNGKRLVRTPGNNQLLQTIAAIYGTAVAKQMVRLEENHPDYRIEGYIARPELTRASRTAVSFIINGRYVRHYALYQALLQGYHTLLPIHRHPLAVIALTMDPRLVDVNVHPAKLEVRFSKEPELLKFVEQAVRAALQQEVLIPSPNRKSSNAKETVIQEQLRFRPIQQKETGATATNIMSQPATEVKKPSHSSSRPSAPVERFKDQTPASVREVVRLYDHHEQQRDKANKKPEFPQLYPIGQMRGTYIIAQNEEGLFLIDQHAAHERIQYEYFYHKFGQPEMASQQMVVPIPLEFTATEFAIVTQQLHWLEQAGVFMEHFGGNTYRITACPHWFPKGEEAEIVREMVEWLIAEKGVIDIAKLREQAAIMCSCKAAIKANQVLNRSEIDALLQRLGECETPYTCPHGRPIIVSFSNQELDQMFKRT